MRRVAAVGAVFCLLAAGGLASAGPNHSRGDIEDDSVQITLNRLAAEAASFDPGMEVALTVRRIDTRESAHVNGGRRVISLSAVKIIWVVAAVDAVGTGLVAGDADPVFRRSDNNAAGRIIDLAGGVDTVNAAARSWGLSDTELTGWSYGKTRQALCWPNCRWGTYDFTTTDDLAAFWAMLWQGNLLDPARTATVLDWARLPRDSESDELLTDRLPSAVATATPHKSGCSGISYLRIDGGVITTPDGVDYAVAIAISASGYTAYQGRARSFARYAACEIYAATSGGEMACTRLGDPDNIVGHSTRPIGALDHAAVLDRSTVRATG